MGYRTRLGRVSKSSRELFINKDFETVYALLNGSEHSIYRPDFHEELLCLGSESYRPNDVSEFYSFDCYEACEGEFLIVSKSGLIEIIDEYHRRVAAMYDELFAGSDAERLSHIARKVQEWGQDNIKFGVRPYYLEQDLSNRDGIIARSWMFEYQIFNIAYIYSTFDWANDYLILNGW